MARFPGRVRKGVGGSGLICLALPPSNSHLLPCRTQEDSTVRISALNAERDDLKALLLATLQVCVCVCVEGGGTGAGIEVHPAGAQGEQGGRPALRIMHEVLCLGLL